MEIDLRSRIPIYKQIKNKILEEILVGALKPNEKLISIRALALELKINVNTVKKSYGELESEGIIYSLPGRGNFVSENKGFNKEVVEKAKKEIKSAIYNGKISGISYDDIVTIVDMIYENNDGGETK